jgi:hypothetical protein
MTIPAKDLRPGDAFVNEDGTTEVIARTFRPNSYPVRLGFETVEGKRYFVGALAHVEVESGASKEDLIGVLLDPPAHYWDRQPTIDELEA